MIDVIVNGETTAVPEHTTVTDLLARLELEQELIAVEVNRRIVGKGQWGRCNLEPGDSVEIVHFVGGG